MSDALQREINEELATEVNVGDELVCVQYDYPRFRLTMHCFVCTFAGNSPILLEHESARWLSADNLHDLKWLPADAAILNKVAHLLQQIEE